MFYGIQTVVTGGLAAPAMAQIQAQGEMNVKAAVLGRLILV